MKKSVPAVIALIGGLLIIAFLGWAFSLHGTIGLYRVNGFFAMIFNIFGALGVVLLAAAVFLQWRKARGKTGFRWLAVVAIVLTVPAVIIPIAAFLLLGGALSGDIGDTPPRLLMKDTTGKYGIPDMALVFTTAAKSGNYVVTIEEQGTGNPEVGQENEASKGHTFVFKDLRPDTAYQYWINNKQPGSFTTPSVDGVLRFAVGSDAHYGAPLSDNDLTTAMLAQIAEPANGYDAFFFLGDLVEYGFLNGQWQEAFTAFSTVTASVPTVFAAGNHDTLFSGTGNYLDYCAVAAQSGSRLWYRVDIGGAHFFVLDVEWSAESVTKKQLQWLEGQLSSVPDDEWKIVLGHGFYYCSGISIGGWDWYDNPETIGKLVPLFEEYGVDLVFSGHNHRLELLEKSGVTYVVCGTFGGHPDPEPTYTSPASVWGMTGATAFADVTLDGDECVLVFRNADGAVLYETSLAVE